jgi:hypothetical protein
MSFQAQLGRNFLAEYLSDIFWNWKLAIVSFILRLDRFIVRFSLRLFWRFITSSKPESTITKKDYNKSFIEIFANRSATACLVGNLTRHAGMQWSIFSSAYFQIIFGLSVADYALLAILGTFLYAAGSIIGGHIVKKVGRKRQVIIWFTLVGIIIMSLTFIPILAGALVL